MRGGAGFKGGGEDDIVNPANVRWGVVWEGVGGGADSATLGGGVKTCLTFWLGVC